MITADAIRRNFPSLDGKCYLNTAAEGIPPLAVGEALQAYWSDKLLGMDGRVAHFAREGEARRHAAQLLGLLEDEVGFCSCSAEAYNLLATALRLESKDEVIVSDLDFPSGFTPWLASHSPPVVGVWKAREGILNLEDLAALLSSKTRLVQVSLVSFYNGWRLPWEPFIQLVRERAPSAVVSVDLTQTLGRSVLDCHGADIMISSTHKWLLGTHGSCVVGIPKQSSERLTTSAGGWYHIRNAFDPDRFDRVDVKEGAASYAVGMPSFGPIYALDAAIRFLLATGVESIAAHADPLVRKTHEGLCALGITPIAPLSASGIVAFKHGRSNEIHGALREENIHIMHQAGRLRVALHGYNTTDDVLHFLAVLKTVLARM
jgi:selenocysteine lyase/cysteine desulfurase